MRRPDRAPRAGRGPWRPARGQRGAMLLVVMIGVALMLVFSGVAVQAWSMTYRRDQEDELIFCGRQIAQAIKEFQKLNGRYPTELKELSEMTGPGGGRYVLRKPYKDPMTDDGEWGYVYLNPQGGTISSGEIQVNQEDARPGAVGQSPVQGQIVSALTLPIVGVHSKSDDEPIGPNKWRNGQKYSEWQFTINDLGPGGGILPGGTVPGGGQAGTQPGVGFTDPGGGTTTAPIGGKPQQQPAVRPEGGFRRR